VLLLRSNDLDEFRFRHELASTHAVLGNPSHQSRSEPICSLSRSPKLVPEEVDVSER
jgi:hypothetical protein